jgi:hypothetical protein
MQHRGPTCNGTAISAATNADIPRKELLVATALDDRPTLASTMYAKVLAYIHLINHDCSDEDRGQRRHDVHRKEPRQEEHRTDR